MADISVQNDDEPPELYNLSIDAISSKTKRAISTLLNPMKIIPNEKGLPRDWQGLAELIGVSGEKIPQLHLELDPTLRILSLWKEQDKKNATIKNLIKHLQEIDRFDIVDDIKCLLDEDIKVFDECKHKTANGDAKPLNLDTDKYILTRDDVKRIDEGLEPQTYDAFVLFADDDIDFATELIETMEKQKNLKFCVKDRDMVGGAFEHEVIIKLIAERCNRLIVIISPAFFKSPANKFFLSFAQAIGIDQRQRKIIPCMYSPCEVPLELKCYYILDYSRKGKLWNFWDKLLESIQTTVPDASKKHNINRSVSHHVRSTQLKPIVETHHTNGLKPKRDCVTFNSLVNIADNTKDASSLAASSSFHAVGNANHHNNNIKSKTSWIKKLLSIKTGQKNAQKNLAEKSKRKFWPRHSKRKVAVAN